jgi:hypothetical protein
MADIPRSMPGMRTRLSTKSRRHVGVLDHRGSDSRRHCDRSRLSRPRPSHLVTGSSLLRRDGDSDDRDGPAASWVCRRSALLEPVVLARSGRPHSARAISRPDRFRKFVRANFIAAASDACEFWLIWQLELVAAADNGRLSVHRADEADEELTTHSKLSAASGLPVPFH